MNENPTESAPDDIVIIGGGHAAAHQRGPQAEAGFDQAGAQLRGGMAATDDDDAVGSAAAVVLVHVASFSLQSRRVRLVPL